MNKKITALFLFKELLETKSIKALCQDLFLHSGTIKRWVEKNEVPENYYNDLNSLLNNKYPIKTDIKENDQYFTTAEISKYCYEKTNKILKEVLEVNTEEYIFIEPSAGSGNFFNLFPKNRRIGIDLHPKNKEIIESNYLDFTPADTKSKYLLIGNPPFGLRGNLALRFINHSAIFADIIAFILPPLFNSDGKGNPKDRIKDYKLVYSENLPLDAFEYPNGKKVKVTTVFQIWSKIKIDKIIEVKKESCKEYIKIYSLSNGKSSGSKRNVNMIGKCDLYLPSTCFHDMTIKDNFEDLPNKRGYGIIILKEKKFITELLKATDWKEVSFKGTNSSLNLRISKIEEVIIKNGLKDKKN